MLNTFIKPALVAATLAIASASSAFADAGSDLLRRVDSIRAPGGNFSFTVAVKAPDGAKMNMSVAIKDGGKGLVQYVAPASAKGRSILFVERNMWIYVPGSRRALRISPQQQIMGGVSSADVARTVYSQDYSVAGVSASGGNQVLKLTAKGGGAAYGRIDLTVNGKAAPQMAVFYASNGTRQLKTVYFEGYKSVLGQSRPTRLRVVDHLAGNAVTTMTYSNFKMAKTPDAWFQPNYLSRL